MIIGIAWKNIFRHKKRTALTALIISIGVVMVILFSGATAAFKKVMVGEITDSMLGHIQVHKKGYMTNADTQALDMVINTKLEKKLYSELEKMEEIEGFTPRLKFSAMVSNYDKSIAMKIIAIQPEKEKLVSPELTKRINGIEDLSTLKKGTVVISEIVAKSMKLKKGDDIVLVGTNAQGSVNGTTLKIVGIIELATGPEGKSGYMHLEDAKSLLRMEEVLEIAIRVKEIDEVDEINAKIIELINKSFLNKEGKATLEVHPWTKLTNFTSTIVIIDVMSVFLKIILIFIVLFSIMNMMVMAVYERTGEIGTISAIGTPPAVILEIFMWEGLFLGFLSSVAGSIVGLIVNYIISILNISYEFGKSSLLLKPEVSMKEIVITIILITIISVVATLIPAYKASRLEPVDALRS